MHAVARIAMGAGVWLSGALPALAAEAPSFVVPGKLGVPVIIDGYDASYAVVERDFGLDRPGQVQPTIILGPLSGPPPVRSGRGYFPAGGEDGPGSKALAILRRDHVESDKLGPVCQHVVFGFHGSHEAFLRAVLEKNPHPDVHALACLSLAQFLGNRLDRLDVLKDQDKPEFTWPTSPSP